MNLDGVTGDARKRIESSLSLPTPVQVIEAAAVSNVDCDCLKPLERGRHAWECIFSGLNNRPPRYPYTF